MTDPNEIGALTASFRGVMASSDALAGLKDQIEAMSSGSKLDSPILEELARLSAAHATAAAALRGLVEGILRRQREHSGAS